jgi:superfamily II DNA or RNA helicase
VARRGVVFTVSVSQAEATATALTSAGIPSACVHVDLDDEERARILRAHRRGEIRVVTNCAVLTEGYDDAGIDLIVVARPTRSKPLYCQMVGRGIRLSPGKEDRLVIDVAGASEEHDLITAAALLEGDDARENKKGRPTGPSSRSIYAGMFAERGRSPYAWLPVPGLDRPVVVLGAGRHGMIALLSEGDDRWSAVHLVRDREPA